jgi:hypothetical protein
VLSTYGQSGANAFTYFRTLIYLSYVPTMDLPFRIGTAIESGPGVRIAPIPAMRFVFIYIRTARTGRSACLIKGMNIWLTVLVVQVIAAVVALVRESGEDKRFEGDKLGYRS